jgi:hypothetical protein
MVGTILAVTLRFPPHGEYSMGAFTIVGVVHNTFFRSLRDRSEPSMYMPFAQRGASTPYTTVFIAGALVLATEQRDQQAAQNPFVGSWSADWSQSRLDPSCP